MGLLAAVVVGGGCVIHENEPDLYDTESAAERVPPCPDEPWISVQMGNQLACGIHDGGCAECWGWQEWGDTAADPPERFDSGTFSKTWTDHNTQFPPDFLFASISMSGRRCGADYQGAYTTCGITIDDGLTCWGPDDFGVAVAGRWSEVVVESEGVCALDEFGVPHCWGEDWPGAVLPPPPLEGLSRLVGECRTFAAIQPDGTPVWLSHDDATMISPLPAEPVSHIDVDESLVCYQRVDGSLSCVNLLSGDVLGVPPELAEPGVTIRDLALHENVAYTLTERGEPLGWLPYQGGELFTEHPAGSFTDLSCGWDGCCALTTDGHATCWDDDGDPERYQPPGSYTTF